MKPGERTIIEHRRQALLGQLKSAEAALRASVQQRGVDAVAHAHLERALSHVNEAYIVLNETGRARTVQQLVEDLTKIDRMLEELRQQPPPGVTVKPLRA